MKRIARYLCALIMLACWSAVAVAVSGDPQQLMHGVTDKILARLKESPELRKDHAGLMHLIEKEVFPLVDFPRSARLILARHWASATETQQQRFIEGLKTRLACIYSTAFASYSGQQVQYLQPRWSKDRKEVEIRINVTQESQAPIPVTYRLQETDGQWKLYDLVVEGVSLVESYRSTFRQRLQQQGGLDALIEDLAARNKHGCESGD